MANHKKTQKPRKDRHPLPKVGTPANDAYRLEHSRRDLVDFGLAGRGRGPMSWLLLALVVVLLAAGVVALIACT